jgi:hypothetical protein
MIDSGPLKGDKMKSVFRTLGISLLLTLFFIACGGHGKDSSNGGDNSTTITKQLLRISPVKGFFHATKQIKQAADNSHFDLIPTAHAQSAVTIGFGNISGFCGILPNPPVSVAATVPFGLGQFTSGNCSAGSGVPDSDDGAIIRESGFIGNFQVSAAGTRTNAQSGRIEIYINNAIIHTMTMGTANSVEDLTHTFPVNKGDKLKVRYWQQIGDQERNLHVDIGFGN